jgi:hypothetical protein
VVSKAESPEKREIVTQNEGDSFSGGASPVRFAAMADRSDVDDALPVVDRVENAVIPDSHAPAASIAHFFEPAGRGSWARDRIFSRTRSMTSPESASSSLVDYRPMVSR